MATEITVNGYDANPPPCPFYQTHGEPYGIGPCHTTAGTVFFAPGNLAMKTFNIAHQDVFDAPLFGISVGFWGLLAYLLFRGRK